MGNHSQKNNPRTSVVPESKKEFKRQKHGAHQGDPGARLKEAPVAKAGIL